MLAEAFVLAQEGVAVSVRHRILVLLCLEPCYGFQLRTEIERRSATPIQLNVGQVYATLERLERDGFAVRGLPDEQGHVFYSITDAGEREAARWARNPVPPYEPGLVEKISFVLSIPGTAASDLLRAQERVLRDALREVFAEEQPDEAAVLRDDTEWDRLVSNGVCGVLEAQLRWVVLCAERLSSEPGGFGFALAAEPPRRGRPALSVRAEG